MDNIVTKENCKKVLNFLLKKNQISAYRCYLVLSWLYSITGVNGFIFEQ